MDSTLLEIIGWTGSALIVISLMLSRILIFRWLNFAGSVVATFYNAWLGIWPFFAMNLVIAIINIVWLVKWYRPRHDAATYQVVEVDPNDAYLLHMQRTHADDIAQYSPAFVPEVPEGEKRHAFIVVNGDQTVGMVEIEDSGEGTGTVLLDWVARRYRDFGPGEFVYRSSGIFEAKGFTRLVTAAGTNFGDKYLESVGFVRDHDTWTRAV
jgi:hypothetical protein